MDFYDYPLDVRILCTIGLFATIYAALAVVYLATRYVLGAPGRRREAADRAALRAAADAAVASTEAAAKLAVAEALAVRLHEQAKQSDLAGQLLTAKVPDDATR
jgi:hypothetical protein